jgi:hypothetical protein
VLTSDLNDNDVDDDTEYSRYECLKGLPCLWRLVWWKWYFRGLDYSPTHDTFSLSSHPSYHGDLLREIAKGDQESHRIHIFFLSLMNRGPWSDFTR